MNDAPNDPDVNQMMAVFDKLSRQADTAKDEMAMAVNSFVGRAQDIIIAKRAEIAQLRAQLAERDATIAELRAQVSNRSVTLARYKHAYQAEKNMFEDCETLRQAEMATVAELRAQVATLTERLVRCADDYGNVA